MAVAWAKEIYIYSEMNPFSSSFILTIRVWRALIFRELQARLFHSRTSMMWLLLEPVFHLSYLISLFTLIKVRHIGGISTGLWLLTGLITYFLFAWTSQRVSQSISSNKTVFAFRQILPMDTLIVRAVIEAILLMIIFLTMYFGINLFVEIGFPTNIFQLVNAWLLAWLTGLGWGMLLCIIHELLPDFYTLLDLIKMPVYFLSGVIFPLSSLPIYLKDILLHNPIAHAVEIARSSVSPFYHILQGVDYYYPWIVAIVLLFTGISMTRKFSRKLVSI